MNETLNRWWAEIQNIINYPLIELGDSRLTLNSIVKLLLVMALSSRNATSPSAIASKSAAWPARSPKSAYAARSS
jgi:hypothetical protein